MLILQNIQDIGKGEFEHKIITPGGKLKYIKVLKGELLKNDDGSLNRIIGILQDITDTRLSEKELKWARLNWLKPKLLLK